MPNSERGSIDYTAQQIRKYFVESKTQQQGHAYRPQPKFNRKEFWTAAAEICIELQADPYSFVISAFLGCAVPGGPFPNQLCGSAIRKWFAAYKKLNSAPDGGDVYAHALDYLIRYCIRDAIQMARLHNRTREQIFLEDFLIQEHQMAAWIRALLCPTPAILKKWGHPAYAEIMSNPRLYSILQEQGYNLKFMETIRKEKSGY